MDGLLIADDASPRESPGLKSAVQPGWIIKAVPARLLGQAFGRETLAYVGILASGQAGQASLQQNCGPAGISWTHLSGCCLVRPLPEQCITGPQAGQSDRQDRTAQEGAK